MSKRKKKFSLLKHMFQAFFVVVFIAVMIVAAAIYMKYGPTVLRLYSEAQKIVASSTEKDFKSSENSLVYDGSGDLLKTLKGDKDAYYLTFDQIPDNVKQALISIEDKKFYQHNGIDAQRIAGSLVANIRHHAVYQGGSTITQQLVKLVYLSQERTYDRKIKEIFIALGIEKKYTKDQILEFYINNIYFGNGYYGIQAAASGYFRKSASALDLSQTAFLCGIPNSPTTYDPYKNPQNTLDRRNLILKQMYSDGKITKAEYDSALAETIKVKKKRKTKISSVDSFVLNCATEALMQQQGFELRYDFASDADRAEYDKQYNEEYDTVQASLYTGGYRIYTSIDMDKQKLLQDTVDNTLANYTETDDKTGLYKLQSSAACIDNSSGRVIAIVGGRSQDDVQDYYLNRAFQSYRQPGSSIKPLIVYTPALEQGYTPDSIVLDTPITDEKNAPKNDDGGYMGRITLRKALEQSRNVVAWRLFKEITPKVGLQYLKNMHYHRIVDSDNVLAAAVGGLTYGSNTWEQASGYATLANEGKYRNPTCIVSITDSDGKDIVSDEVKETEIYDRNADLMMIDMMKGVLIRGTGAGLGLSNKMPAAAKTGTTDGNKDGWFCGFTRYYTTAVWVGYDTPATLTGLFGSTYPGKIWHDYMEQIHTGLQPLDWDEYTINGKPKNQIASYNASFDAKSTTEKKKKGTDDEDDDEDDDEEDEDDTPVVTEAPIVTETPVTEAPATQAPATQAPATQAPATQAPATQAPATQAPATQAPATQAPPAQ